MLVQYSTLAVIMASMAIGAPLNINLGAYSPALVVGDGEISFAGAGANGAAGLMNTLQGAAAAQGGAVAQGAAIAPAAAAATTAEGQTTAAAQGVQRSSVLSEPASLPVPGVARELGPRQVDDEVDEAEDEAEVEKRQEGGLMKRQSSGFDRALTFAEAALTKGPKVQLGTGEGGAGVGIIVDNNPAAAALPGTGVAAAE